MKKGFFISPLIILFFLILAGVMAIYLNDADSTISTGISFESLIRKNNIQLWNEQSSFSSGVRTKVYELVQHSASTNELENLLSSESGLDYVNFINDSFPFLKLEYTLPEFSSSDGISNSIRKNVTIMINYPFLDAVGLIDAYNEIHFCNLLFNYEIDDWRLVSQSYPYAYFANENYNITGFYPFGVRRTTLLC